MPAIAQIARNELTVTTAAGLQVSLRNDSWTVESSARNGGQRRATAVQSSGCIGNRVASSTRGPPARPILLSSIEPGFRRVWRAANAGIVSSTGLPVATTASTSNSPPGPLPPKLAVRSMGSPLRRNSPQAHYALELSPARQQHVLDFSYRFATHEKQSGHLMLVAPRLAKEQWVRQIYWQLVLSRNEHLVSWPSDLTGAFQWRLQAGSWGRQPLVEQPQLESWSNALPGVEVPQQTNRYVLTSLGSIETLDVYTASRATLVMAGAGSVLAMGLLFCTCRPAAPSNIARGRRCACGRCDSLPRAGLAHRPSRRDRWRAGSYRRAAGALFEIAPGDTRAGSIQPEFD